MNVLIAVLLLAQSFQQNNPGYRERAGGFYEESYLGPASESLAKTIALERFTKADASRVLRTYIYDWLDGFVAGEGEMSRAAHVAAVGRADISMKQLLDSEPAFRRWQEWRERPDRNENPLAFITSSKIALTGLSPALREPFSKDGWTLRTLEDDEQIAPYRRFFPTLPHQVFVLEKEKTGRLALLVFRVGRAKELLEALDTAMDADVRVFWKTFQFLVFAVEKGSVPELLKEDLRRQLAATS
jgi:hypothetical protein